MAKKTEETAQVVLFVGTDEYRVKMAASALVNEWVPEDQQAFGLEIIDGGAGTVDEAIACVKAVLEALQTLGFLASEKTVWLQSANFLHDNVVGKSAAVKEMLAKLAELITGGLAPGCRFVVSAAKADKRYAFYKACKASGRIVEHALDDNPRNAEKQTGATLDALTRERGIRFDRQARTAFLQRVGPDTRQIMNELEKVELAILPRKDVSRADVAGIVSWSRQLPVWDLPDAVAAGDARGAIMIMRRLIQQKEQPIGLISTIEGRYRDMLVVREALDRGWVQIVGGGRRESLDWGGAPPDVIESCQALKNDPRKQHPYRALLLAKQALSFTVANILGAMRECMNTHERLVSSSIPAELQLELLILRLTQRSVAAS